MKTKRILAWLLVCVLQLGVCLIIPWQGQKQEHKMEREGEPYRFALCAVRRDRRGSHPTVSLEFPPAIPASGDIGETTVPLPETGKDGLTRVRETWVSFAEAQRLQNEGKTAAAYPLYGVYSFDASLLVSDRVLDDLEILMEIMTLIRQYTPNPEDIRFTAAQRQSLTAKSEAIGTEALRLLAQRQIEERNGDELHDSYVTGILYEEEIFFRDVYVAGIHVASIHD